MKVFLPLLLAALLGVEQAHCLMCFTCQNQKSNWYCLKPTICSDTDSYCVTTSVSAGLKGMVDLGYSLNKFCSPICGSTNLNFGVASMDSSCCQSFLCNISAADGVPRASTPVLGLGLLLSLLAALLWARP
ncbi:lymphocyte antigen 6E isoform 1-T2 [Dama dama]|uniref:lymphocyte antigen 6E n=1 Tax=Dama dama TaxID=30532 RepID=UPI002A35D16A|nr:lymphocyte antigen 6E [Dama dama]XP_060979070.1 lymphocyte antigen 6E [Dama dama]